MRLIMVGTKQLGALLAVGVIALGACSKEEKAAARLASSAVPAVGTANEGEVCVKSSDCTEGLSCADDKTCQTAKTIECRGRQLACQVEGRCTGQEGRCVAASVEGCKSAEICTNDGRCTPKDGTCQAVSKDDCQGVCKEHGRCSAEGGECLAASEEECQASRGCETNGRCKLVDSRCVEE